jgi:hypothetical protein
MLRQKIAMQRLVNESKNSSYLSNSSLIIFSFATAFFPRIIQSVGIPAVINFLHFLVVPLSCFIVITTTKVKDNKQISIVKALFIGLLMLMGVMTASALFNKAGIINVLLGWILLAEPFLLLLAIISIPMSLKSYKKFRYWILAFVFFHIFLAICQRILIDFGFLYTGQMTREDNVQGVFYLSGAGHVVAASVSLSFGLYFLLNSKLAPLWSRILVFSAAFMQLLFADSKQTLMVFMAAWLLLMLIRIKDIKVTIQYLIVAVLVGFIFIWCLQNVPAFAAFNTWIRPEIYAPDGEATILKTQAFQIIPTYFTSTLNWLLGLGPGHTVGRLGGWMIQDYGNIVIPLGATSHPASEAVWATWRGHWLNSSFFAPLFGWVGIWGDLGFLGLGVYLYLGWLTWRYLCVDDFSRFIVLTVIIFGLIYTQMEEPGYMLSVACLIALRWHEQKISKYEL